jgi:hypothetical protein
VSDALLQAKVDAARRLALAHGPEELYEALLDISAALAERIPREPTEVERLAEIEHLVWHCLDDSEERNGEQIIFHDDNFRKLVSLLSEDHPTTVAVGGLAAVPGIPRERDAERYLTALRTIQQWDCLNPPRSDLLSDLPWLRNIVDAAISGDSHG